MRTKYTMKQMILRHKLWLMLVIFATCAYSAGEIMKAYVMQVILDSAIDASMRMFQKALILAAIYLIVLLVTYHFLYYCKERFKQNCMITMKQTWYDEIWKKQLCDYDVEEASTYLSHFTADALTIETEYLERFLTVLQDIIGGVAALAAILRIHYAFAIFILLSFWVPMAVSRFFGDKLTQTQLEASEENGKFVALVKEQFSGFEVSRLFGIQAQQSEKFQKASGEVEEKRFRLRWTGDLSEICSFAASMFIFLGIYMLGAFLAVRGLITGGSIINVAQLMNYVATPLQRLAPSLTKMKAADELWQKIYAKLNIHSDEEEKLELKAFQKQIQFQDIMLEQGGRQILKQVNLLLLKGRKYLIVGESGTGKSSLVKMLLGIYGRYQGKITVDGYDLAGLRLDSWYRHLSVVSQDGFVFHDMIRQNITLFQPYEKEEVERVTWICGLEEFVKAQKKGLDSMIEENGKIFPEENVSESALHVH